MHASLVVKHHIYEYYGSGSSDSLPFIYGTQNPERTVQCAVHSAQRRKVYRVAHFLPHNALYI